MDEIVRETNRYATTPDAGGKLKGGSNWEQLSVSGLKAFMALALYMEMKKQPNYKTYWMRGSLFHCPRISSIFSRSRFIDLRRCLHLTKSKLHGHMERGDLGFDKLHQTRWLLNATWDSYKDIWNLGKHVTIDEMMICFKSTYCSIRQYMLNKPEKWGVKVWCLACYTSKYVWNFEVYCRNQNPSSGAIENVDESVPRVRYGEPSLAYNVVLKMVEVLSNVGHVVVMDNFFSSIELFKELLSKGIYATGIVRPNQVGLPSELANTKLYKNHPQGHTLRRMHDY